MLMKAVKELAPKLSGVNKILPRTFSSSSDSPVYVVFGSGGIGTELVKHLKSQHGATVVAGSDDTTQLRELESDRCSIAECNVLDTDSVAEVLNKAAEQHGRVDGVCNAVGSMLLKPAHLTGLEEFDDALKINLHSCFNVLKAAVRPMMKSEGGAIVFCSGAVAHRGTANLEAIMAAKGGVEALMRGAAATYGPHNIRVNAVAPGVVDTPMTEPLTKSSEAKQDTEKMMALGRVGTPGEVARAIAFLMHPDQSLITGAVLNVDGGWAVSSPR